MSTVDFNKRANLDIIVTINGNGQFDPFGSFAFPVNWTLSGTISAKNDEPTDLTNKQRLRCTPLPADAIWTEFGAPESLGNESSFIESGLRPTPIIFEGPLGGFLGDWTVNTKPVFSNNGMVDGELAKKGYYVVQIAKDKTEDDPIELDPTIDGLAKVYPGDLIYSLGDEVNRQWKRQPRERWPRPDRTFFWQPNVNPFVEEDGKIDGEMAKPGTVILPTETLDFTDPTKPFLNRYAYAGYGWMFNGYQWLQLTNAPTKYQPPKENPSDPQPAPEYRDLFVYYSQPGRFAGCLEQTQRQKSFVYTTQRIDDSATATLIITPEPVPGQPPPPPETFNLRFAWAYAFAENGIQSFSDFTPIYDFADPWTAYHKANIKWCKDRNLQFVAAPFTLTTEPGIEPQQSIELNVQSFEDGNVTTITQEIKDENGTPYVNEYTISLSIQASMT